MSSKKKKPSAGNGATPRFAAIPVVAMVGCGLVLMLGARVQEGRVLHLYDLFPYALWLGSLTALVLVLRLGRFQGNGKLVGCILLLSGLGVLVRGRMTDTVEPGWLALLVQPLGMVWIWLAWLFCRRGRITAFRGGWPVAFAASLAVVAALVLAGTRFRGAFYGPGGMTPTEILKLLVPFALAGYFARRIKTWKGRSLWRPPVGSAIALGVGTGMLGVLLVLQRDMGMIVMLGGMLVVVLVTLTGSWSWAGGALAAVVAGGWAVMQFLPHGARRLEAWLNPFEDPTGSGWQVLQGLSGLYAGGLIGTGLGGGQPDRIPIASSDFVYAVIGEELGYVGCLLVLGVFGVLLRQAAAVANLQEKEFSFLLATGLVAVLGVQILVNIGGVVALVPVTGIPLPYISHGGTSYWVASVQFGLLLGLSEPGGCPKKKSKKKGSKKRKK